MKPTDKAKQELAKTKPTDILALINNSVKELGKALPRHMNAERLVRIATTTMRLNPALYKCEPMSFLGALFQSAQLGLEPNIEGQAYIIPYGGQAQFQIGYKGYVELFFRHELALSLDMQEVYEKDDFDFQYGTESHLRHKPAMQDRGEVIAYYAVAKLKGNAVQFKVMSKEDCIKHGKQHSKTFNSPSSPWQKDTDAMCKKTVLIQLMKLLPKSIEIQKALAMDETIKTKIDPDMFTVKNELDYEEQIEPTTVIPEMEVKAEQSQPAQSYAEMMKDRIKSGVEKIVEKNAPDAKPEVKNNLFGSTLKRLSGFSFMSDLDKLTDPDLSKIVDKLDAELNV